MCLLLAEGRCSTEVFQGLVDLAAQVAKCDNEINLARLNLEKLYKVKSQPDYQMTCLKSFSLTTHRNKISSKTNSFGTSKLTFSLYIYR